MSKKRQCWRCFDGTPVEGRTCGDCRSYFRSEYRCKSSAECGRFAGEGEFGMFCRDHAVELAEIREQWFTTGGTVRRIAADELPAPPKPQPATDIDRQRAEQLAEIVRNASRPLVNAGDYLGLPRTSEHVRRAVEIAKAEGWIRLENGRGFVPGDTPEPQRPSPPRLPRHERALAAAKVVREAGGRAVSRSEVAASLGMREGALERIVKYARDKGWIVARRGSGGGFVSGPTPVP